MMAGLGEHHGRRQQHHPIDPRHARGGQDGEGTAQTRSDQRDRPTARDDRSARQVRWGLRPRQAEAATDTDDAVQLGLQLTEHSRHRQAVEVGDIEVGTVQRHAVSLQPLSEIMGFG
jgi:hypothetical protein